MELNTDIFYQINGLGKELPFLDMPMMFIANYTLYFLILAVIFYSFNRGSQNRVMVLSALASVAVGVLFGRVAGMFHSNNQPFAELPNVNQLIEKTVDNSFPSDHTIIFFAVCYSFFLYKKPGRYMWMALACIVGISRIWVGVHYPGDILVGALLAMLSAFLLYILVQKMKFSNRKKQVEIPTAKEKNY
ncbi:undecaprenyl-diphosphatase [Bacillus timonensis]|uniref:undecaprenyl-diphosphatase n=1 Tax=Bacillus timonensis TaxID=1033734 RepID=UPI001E596797|nr:undecaprenyl-diphosphatase [Bacillus timonensis]